MRTRNRKNGGRDLWANKAMEPTADGDSTIADNITSPTLVMPLSTAVAQLGR